LRGGAWLITPDSEVPQHYIKSLLIPFAESVPLKNWFTWPIWLIPPRPEVARGPAPRSYLVPGGVRVGIMICWESLFTDYARELAKDDTTVLLMLANEGWFGATAAGASTSSPHAGGGDPPIGRGRQQYGPLACHRSVRPSDRPELIRFRNALGRGSSPPAHRQIPLHHDRRPFRRRLRHFPPGLGVRFPTERLSSTRLTCRKVHTYTHADGDWGIDGDPANPF